MASSTVERRLPEVPPGRSPWRWLLAGAIALVIVAGAGWYADHRPPPRVERTASGGGPRSYAAAILRANQLVDGASSLEQSSPGEWLVEERLANAYIARARLTGNWGDYAAAQQALDRGFATAPAGAGPHLTQAMLAFAMHRLQPTVAALDAIDHYAVPAEKETRIEAAATRGDIAFYRGRYDEALRRYQTADNDPNDRDSPTVLLRVANFDARTGQPDAALALIDRCERTARLPNANYLADLALRRGTIELQRGHWDEATADFDRAARLFPGWWLAEAHQAQMAALTGRTDAAIAGFAKVARTAASPEAMDALASLYRARGDHSRSAFWADAARMIWNQRLGQFPEAAYGHTVEHLLAFGDPATALDLARRDYANRPYGLTATALGWALIATNDPKGALAVIDPVLRSKWVSAETHLAASQAHLLLGQTDAADAEQQAALAINPHAADRSAALIWFGH
jgi:tetratricopeptide (TPR) repeat protein